MCECGKQNLFVIKSLDDPREKKVFDIISKEPANFTTIKNKIGLHQEITTRVLKRLENKLIVRKMGKLYDLCCAGCKLNPERK